MPKGIIKLSKSSKGKIIVALDRLNGKSPMPLSSVSFNDMTFNEKDCDYGFENGQVTYIKIDNVQVYPSVSAAPIAYPQRGNSPMQQTQGVKQMPDSFDMKKTLLAQNVRSIQIHDIDNFNLKLYKAQRFDSEKDKFYFFKNDKRTSKEGVVSGDSFLIRPNYGDLDFNQINKRLATQANMYNNEKIEFQPDWRMIVGIGGGSVYEVSMTLHHLYGCPYIPASSIKGLVRSWIIQNCFGTEGGDETKPSSEAEAFNKSKLLCDIFGCAEKTDYKIDIVGKKDKVTKSEDSYYKKQKNQEGFDEKQGDVIFFDAFPTNAPNIEVDIMNVHYQDYYSDADKESQIGRAHV